MLLMSEHLRRFNLRKLLSVASTTIATTEQLYCTPSPVYYIVHTHPLTHVQVHTHTHMYLQKIILFNSTTPTLACSTQYI